MTYEQEIEEAKVVDQETADETTRAMVDHGLLTAQGEVTPLAKKMIFEKVEDLPPVLQAVKKLVDHVVMQSVEEEKPVVAQEMVGQAYISVKTEEKEIAHEEAEEIVKHFEKEGYIDKKGKIKDTLKVAIQNNTVNLTEKYQAAKTKSWIPSKEQTASHLFVTHPRKSC